MLDIIMSAGPGAALAIDADFCGGNIEVVSAAAADDVRLTIRRDNNSQFLQWFSFRVHGAQGIDCRFTIENASEGAYPEGWTDYRAVISHNGDDWQRTTTDYVDGTLRFSARPESDCLHVAYFVPYPMERHAALISRVSKDHRAHHEVLGQTLDGQPLDLLTLADPEREQNHTVWITARQHPGETMAEWWVEGALESLLDPADPVSRSLLRHCRFHIIPNINPDGSKRGHLRTNALGVNLNRVWHDPTMETAPEVALVRAKMHETGVDFAMDIHGDEALPYNFFAGFEGIANLDQHQLKLFERYERLLADLSPDFQTDFGYPRDLPGSSTLKKCTDYVASTFNCPALTLEMPFKDNFNLPDETEGWSPARSKCLARHCLHAFYLLLPDLKAR